MCVRLKALMYFTPTKILQSALKVLRRGNFHFVDSSKIPQFDNLEKLCNLKSIYIKILKVHKIPHDPFLVHCSLKEIPFIHVLTLLLLLVFNWFSTWCQKVRDFEQNNIGMDGCVFVWAWGVVKHSKEYSRHTFFFF